MVAKKETVAKKKTIGKEKPKKENQKSKKISLDHDFSFNLLTEPWLPVVTMKAEKKLLSLNEFLKSAHELERFDFPLPGLETAVIRFLVAIVYIVGAPKDKEDWEAWYNAGKFYDSFIKELQSYKDKLDLFSKTEPFMQEVNITEDKVKSRTKFKIIDFIPSGNNSIHFGNIDLKKKEEIYISPQAAILLLLFHQMIPRSLAAGSNERYINGIIGQSIPYFCYLKSSNLFESILANVLDEKYIKDNLEGKVLTELNGWNQLKVNKDLKAKEISLPLGFLWKSRSILFLPEQGIEKVCSILGIKSNISISKFCYAPQKHILLNKDESPWEDPFNAIKIVTETNKKGNKKSVIKKLTVR
jgi:CRISPR type I-E-associated protein CasA/Cse1